MQPGWHEKTTSYAHQLTMSPGSLAPTPIAGGPVPVGRSNDRFGWAWLPSLLPWVKAVKRDMKVLECAAMVSHYPASGLGRAGGFPRPRGASILLPQSSGIAPFCREAHGEAPCYRVLSEGASRVIVVMLCLPLYSKTSQVTRCYRLSAVVLMSRWRKELFSRGPLRSFEITKREACSRNMFFGATVARTVMPCWCRSLLHRLPGSLRSISTFVLFLLAAVL